MPKSQDIIGKHKNKVIINSRAITIALQILSLSINYLGVPSAIRIKTLNAVPTITDQILKIKCHSHALIILIIITIIVSLRSNIDIVCRRLF